LRKKELNCNAAEKIEMTEADKQFDTLIVGMGKTGYSCARYLFERGAEFAMTDSRANPPMLDQIRKEFPQVPLYTGGFDPGIFATARELLVSPGVSLREPAIVQAVRNGASVCGDIELFCRNAVVPIIAITGSNGKSTVTTLVAEMIREAGLKAGVGANLGTPALDLLRETETDFYVLELSSFQLETVQSLNATAAVVLNVSEDHMDRYADMQEYAGAKARIYAGDGAMIINLDDPLVAAMQRTNRKMIGFTLSEPSDENYGVRVYENERWLVKGKNRLLPAREIRIAGDHNIANALAALALGEVINLPHENMFRVLRTFPGLPHRCEWVADADGIRWINDSKGTNVGASVAAIRGLATAKNIVLIAGGDGKGADFLPLADIADKHIRAAVLIGRDAPLIQKVLQGVVPVEKAKDMDAAVSVAARLAQRGDVVLLSPACASLDMFQDYRARGDAFRTAVLKMVKR
jgi:UDP-N-acetylmuramoylalanine--D-glutamate ligase